MPKYNLLDSDDAQSFGDLLKDQLKKDSKAKSDSDREEQQPEDWNSEIQQPEDEPEPEINISSESDEEEISPDSDLDYGPEDEPGITSPPVTEPTPPMEPFPLDSEYRDDKQPGLNYRPILIGLGAAAVLALLFFVISNLFFGDDSAEPTETVAETPEQILQRERQEQRLRILGTVNQRNNARLNRIIPLIDNKPSDLVYSSFLIYDDAVNFEIFARKRDDIARFNMDLKSRQQLSPTAVSAVHQRPGSNGGVFSLYDFKVPENTPTPDLSDQSINTISPTDWIERCKQQYNLSLKKQRQISTHTRDMFSISRYEYILEGSESQCYRLVKDIYNQNWNFEIHKMTILPTNQKNMAGSPYEIRLVMDFYI